jgi:hypothetical protein
LKSQFRKEAGSRRDPESRFVAMHCLRKKSNSFAANPPTTLIRTLRDLCSRLSVTEAVTAVDMALHAGLVTLDDLNALLTRRSHSFGVARLRRVVGFVEPAAESPMESRLRMVLVLGGLPRPLA